MNSAFEISPWNYHYSEPNPLQENRSLNSRPRLTHTSHLARKSHPHPNCPDQ